MEGSIRPNGSEDILRCGRCHRLCRSVKERILHAQLAHKIDRMPYPCLECGIAGYQSRSRLRNHMHNKCPGQGWETRFEANGDIRMNLEVDLPQGRCSRRTSIQLGEAMSKVDSNFDPLSNGKVQRRTSTSTSLGDQNPQLSKLRRSSLRHAQSEDLTNDQHEIYEGFSSKLFSKEETSVNPPSEVSPSHESLPISVRMSTRMRTMTSSEQKRMKDPENSSLVPLGQLSVKMLKGGTKRSPKSGRKDALSNLASSNGNRSLTASMELKKKSTSLKNAKLDSARSPKKFCPIAIKAAESTVGVSGNSRALVELTTGPGSLNTSHTPRKSSKLHADPSKSRKSTTDAAKQLPHSHDSSINQASLNVSLGSKKLRSNVDVRSESVERKKEGSAKLKTNSSVIHRRINQIRSCKKVVLTDLSVNKDIPFGNAAHHAYFTESVSHKFVGNVSLSGIDNQSSTEQSGTFRKVEKEISTAGTAGVFSNASPSLELLEQLTKRSSRKLATELSNTDCKKRNKAADLGNDSIALRNQPSALKSFVVIGGKKGLGASSSSQTTVMLANNQRETLKSVRVSKPSLPTLLKALVKVETITDKSKINSNSGIKSTEGVVKSIEIKSDELTSEPKSSTTEIVLNDDVEAVSAMRNRCDVAQTSKSDLSEASADDKRLELMLLQEALGVNEMSRLPKRSTPVKPTGSTTETCVKSTEWMGVSTAGKLNDGSHTASLKSSLKSPVASSKGSPNKSKNLALTPTSTTAGAVATPASITASTSTVSIVTTTTSPAGKVALVDWDCFIAKDPRKARCNSVSVTNPATAATHHSTKLPLHPSIKSITTTNRSPKSPTFQTTERRPHYQPKKSPADEDSTSLSSKRQVTGDVNSDNCRPCRALFCNPFTLESVQLFAEERSAECATASKFSEGFSPKLDSTSLLDSSPPTNGHGKLVEPKSSDITTRSSSGMSDRVCGKENETAAKNLVSSLPVHDNSDSNSEATAPAVNNSQDLLISPVDNRDVESNQTLRKRLRPRKSIDYFESAKTVIKKVKMEEVENKLVLNDEDTKLNGAWKDEDDEEEVNQEKNKRKGKHMTTHCCPVCRLTGFATLAELKVHRKISCRRKLKPKRLNEHSIVWYCPGCPTTQGPFESAAALLKHLPTCRTKKLGGGRVKANHPALSIGPLCPSTLFGPSTTFGCSICGVIVASESRLDQHRRDEHNY
ncbi:Zinc finger C2H2 [Echinococcus multilocularis]|uniref:Zinc finger C2H2 n=1 Tax=Echinococcus multilocularis TaxID=6211 RepID=A0A087W0C8_ECHMU|nr:Zinc finger C2H2 [Echinococcus multilocularis]